MPNDLPSGNFERNTVTIGGTRITSSAELPAGVSINFTPRSAGNRVEIAPDQRVSSLTVDLGSARDCTVQLGRLRVPFGGLRVSFVANNGRISTGSEVTVGDGCTFNGSTHIIGALSDGVAVRIGRDCLFASGVTVRGSSHHGLWDLDSGALLNPEAGIEIGDHVWLGASVIVLNKSAVPSGSVVAARSIVNRQFSDENVLLAGSPAAVRRSRVAWTHDFPVDNGVSRRDPEAIRDSVRHSR
ncbi:acetyltransferase-like isoleucine patch superfamily enzyme [Promicromonospora sp. AC04]|uniref:acyltransferase n=1 Tax=Promicromonospora sp. AC04 TaxID=2135723 RepID=UPI000D4C65F1|nr:hypothetical protein [Promicromonospora sp. AC04]PUB32374.1 acetyltransferase-like isoleucine patch superfamily enzyme [Promicromonospora sp. AC04]